MIKKLTITSLVASACIFSNVYANNTLEETFKNGKVKGEIKSYFFQEDYDATGRSSIMHFGGLLNYETASFNGVTLGSTFQVSSVADVNGINKFVSDEDASGSVMSEAFITYSRNNTSLKAGRQFIGTPLLAGSGSRMIRQSFQGYTITNSDITDTKLMVSYVNRFQTRTNEAGKPGKFTKKFNTNTNLDGLTLNDGAYSLYLENKSISNLNIEAQYLNAIDVFASTYLNAKYDLGTTANLYVVGQHISTNYDINNPSGNFFAARVGGDYKNLTFKLSATSNTSNGDVESGLGYGSDYSLAASEIGGGYYSYLKDNKSYQVGVGTTISNIGIDLLHTENKVNNGNDNSETDLIVSYNFSKDLNFNILHAAFDGGDKNYETRVKVTYKF